MSSSIQIMKEFQSLLFTSELDIQAIKNNINELKNKFSVNEIDSQIILAISLNYEKIPTLLPFLSETKIEKRFFIHYDQTFLFHLLAHNISFPLSLIFKRENFKLNHFQTLLEKSLYEELVKQNKLDLLKEEIKHEIRLSKKIHDSNFDEEKLIEIREKEKIEEIIEADDIESFRIISNENNFHFNRRIKKCNELFKYTEIPIISYCIEKNAIKCFKYALINGSDPSQKSIYTYIKEYSNKSKEIWDGYGFAGAMGNIQIIKMIEDQGTPINGDVIRGCSKFHQNHIIHWAEKEFSILLKDGVKECIQFYNIEAFNIINNNFDINLIGKRKKTPFSYEN